MLEGRAAWPARLPIVGDPLGLGRHTTVAAKVAHTVGRNRKPRPHTRKTHPRTRSWYWCRAAVNVGRTARRRAAACGLMQAQLVQLMDPVLSTLVLAHL